MRLNSLEIVWGWTSFRIDLMGMTFWIDLMGMSMVETGQLSLEIGINEQNSFGMS